jgi:hypothetical protein
MEVYQEVGNLGTFDKENWIFTDVDNQFYIAWDRDNECWMIRNVHTMTATPTSRTELVDLYKNNLVEKHLKSNMNFMAVSMRNIGSEAHADDMALRKREESIVYG